jgi:hypothetical protein
MDNHNNFSDKDKKNSNQSDNSESLHPSESDPQKTEMEGLKKGGVKPVVHPDDKAKDGDGKPD